MIIKQEKGVLKNYGRRHKLKTVKVTINFILGLIWLFLLVLTLVTDPIILALKAYTRVTNGSFVHEFMMKEMEGIHIQVYLFNVTNAQEFMSGDDYKLKVQEVGPFTYKEMRNNIDIVIDEEAQRMWYTPNIRLQFVPEESIGLPEDVNITVPNIPMLGTAAKMAEYPYITRLGFNLLAAQLNSKPIVSLNAQDYLWGYDEPLVALSHNLMPGSVHFDKMGILDRINDPHKVNRLEISIADEDKYMIKSLNGRKKLGMGEDIDPDMCTLCNSIENTYEGVGYHPDLNSDFEINLYRVGLCRVFEMEYFGPKTMEYGADAMVYHFKDNFYQLDRNESSNGMIVLPDCFMGVPLAFSKAHFLDVDPSVYERIEGVDPNPERFQDWIAVDPRIGLQLETVISLQLNLVIGDITSNAQAKSFANMVLPICFLHIVQSPLPEESKFFLNGVYRTGPRLILTTQICSFVLLLLSWGYCASAIYLHYRFRDDKLMSFPLAPDTKEINANNIENPLMKEVQNLEES